PVAHRPYRPPVRPVRTNMNGARPNRTTFNKQAHSYANRPFQRTSAVRPQFRAPWVPTVNRNFPHVNRKFSTGSRNFPTANRKFPITSRKFPTRSTKCSIVDMGMKGKASSSQNNIDDKGYWDIGCSRHMTGNISYLSNYEPFDGGYVSFGQGGCKITGKGTIKTGKLEFENVYFVKDLKYNVFSVSQICDNKNNVLFTDSECIVLGRDFKLLDDANIFLRTPRQHNMFSIDLNNIIPHRDLTCLVVKASADECMLWHRRLGHLNFKTMNKLVRHNLVRGLPTKCFENDHTCTACLKGKQHKASYNLGKFEAKGDKGYFIGYSMSSKAFRVFDKRTMRVEENLHVEFLENKAIEKGTGPNWLFDIDSLTKSMNYVPVDAGSGNPNPTASTSNLPADQMKTLTVETLIPTVSSPVLTAYFTDSQEPSNESNGVEADISNMKTAITASPTPTLRIHKDHPKVLKNKKDERGIVIRNKARLVAQDPEFPAKVYKVEKAMYGLHQAPRAWYGTLSKYLLKNGFQKEVRSSNTPMDKENPWGKDRTGKDVDLHLYRSMIGSLMYLTASRPYIMFVVCACARHQVTPKECHLHAVKRIFRYLKGHPKLGLCYPKESHFDLVAYLDSDYGGATQYRKSTTGGCQFLGRRLISWQCKKQTIVATSTTKAEYVAAASCYGQVLLSMPCEALSREISSSILRLISLRLIPLSEHNVDFHPMVDFVEASPLMYALTFKPTVYVSHIRQFWSTARIETTKEGTKILATVDGILRTVTESSLRRNIKLQDEEGISSLPDTELFENLTLMGSNISTALICLATNRTYNISKIIIDGLVKNVNNKVSKFLMYPRFLTMCLRMSQFGQITHTHMYEVPFHTRKRFTTLRVNSPSFSGRIVPLFDTMLVQQGEGLCTPTEPHHTPSPEAQPPSHTNHSSSTLSPVTTTTSIPTVTPSDSTRIRQYTRRARIAQSSALPLVADEPASHLRDASQGEACPTDSGFIADQDMATIAKSFTLPYDLAPRVTSYAADEGKLLAKFQAQEVEINRLKERVRLLEDREGVAAERSRDDAPIKGRNMDEEEAVAERVSDDAEEMATVLTSIDAATVLAGGVADIPTGSGSIPTAAEVPTGSDVVPTSSPVFATATVVTPYRRRKGKEVMVESETPKKQKVQEQIDAQVARELEEQLEREDQRMSEQIARDAEVARIHFASELPLERRIELISDLVRYQDNYAKVHKFQSQQRKPWTKKQKRDYYMAVIRSNLCWKVKDFRGMTFEEVEVKFNSVWKQIEDFIPMGSKEEAERLKRKGLSMEQESAKKFKPSDEVPEEVKSPDEVPEEKVKEMMQLVPIEEVEDLNQLWALANESLSNRPPTSDKEMELWVELSRLYEPNDEDQLWTHTQNLMHAPVEWKLYDSCGVHRVTAKDKEIFMLVEKDYPLRKGLTLVMISYKLQVENYSRMANDIILKIYKIASTPRQQGD
nr:ribonuclease H-like domain-containing protein [Tanacetum cinerariifolium]